MFVSLCGRVFVALGVFVVMSLLEDVCASVRSSPCGACHCRALWVACVYTV